MQETQAHQINFDEIKQRIDDTLLTHIAGLEHAPARLKDAISYVVQSGGKRLRPMLVYAVGLALDADIADLERPASAIELIHTYSLIHDDLPAMDDDKLRRGHPTCHIAFDEATAILAGDALQSLAFEILSEPYPTKLDENKRIKIIHTLAQSSGAEGMAGGQSLDLSATGKNLSLAEIEKIHTLKTGKLLATSIMVGAHCASVSHDTLEALETFANKIGLAYQIHDDILDIESSTEQLGKTQGADIKQNKSTYPSVVGIEDAKNMRDWLFQKASSLLDQLDYDMSQVQTLVEMMIHRKS